MLNTSLHATYTDPTGGVWEYYGDDALPSTYYIIPRPQYVFDAQGNPSFKLVIYETDDATNGSGYCAVDVQLGVPDAVKAAIAGQIGGPTTPTFDALPVEVGGVVTMIIPGQDRVALATAPVSGVGGEVAHLVLELTKTQIQSLQGAFTTKGGGYEVEFTLTVPARLPAVHAVLSFNAQIAYAYQVTQPSYNDWGDETSPGSVQQILQESESSTVTLDWGVATPSDQLRQAVANWANLTLASQVQAEVQQTIALMDIQSGTSFNINDVSSFTSTYDSNEVIDWIVVPTSTLPSFLDLGLQMDQFTSTVDARQQVMQVSVPIPFAAPGAAATAPQSVSVTVTYPGLDQADATYEFTGPGAHTFTTAYNPEHGPTWELAYVATYTGSQVEGTISGIEQGLQTIQLSDIGIVSMVFDASSAFGPSVTPMPSKVNVMATYANFDGQGTTYDWPFVLTAAQPTTTLTAKSPSRLTDGISYRVTYDYAGAPSFEAPIQTNRTGRNQLIPAAAGLREVGLLIMVPASASPQIIEADVEIYYAGDPAPVPGAKPGYLPVATSSARFTLVPAATQAGIAIAHDQFIGLVNVDQPIVYSATLTADDGSQIAISEQRVENDWPTISVSPTAHYFTLKLDPSAIDWATAPFDAVQILVNSTVSGTGYGTGPQAQRTMQWTKAGGGVLDAAYFTWSTPGADVLSYTWQANYITTGKGIQTTALSAAQTDTVLDVPPTPPTGLMTEAFVEAPAPAMAR